MGGLNRLQPSDYSRPAVAVDTDSITTIVAGVGVSLNGRKYLFFNSFDSAKILAGWTARRGVLPSRLESGGVQPGRQTGCRRVIDGYIIIAL